MTLNHDPPCTGATWSYTKEDNAAPLQADQTDDGKPEVVPAGKRIFRVRITIHIPASSSPTPPLDTTVALTFDRPARTPTPDFRLVLTDVSPLTTNGRSGTVHEFQAFGEIVVGFDVTNDGTAEGTGHVNFHAVASDGRDQPVVPDTARGVVRYGPAPGSFTIGSRNCQGAGQYLLKPGQTEHVVCVLMFYSRGPPPLGGVTVTGDVQPFDDGRAGSDDDTATDNIPPPENVTVIAAPTATIDIVPKSQTKAGALNGQAKPAGKARRAAGLRPAAKKNRAAIRRVLVALVRVPPGLHGASNPTSCKWLADPNGKFVSRPAKKGVCTQAVFLPATSTTKWSLKLAHPLPCGSYVAYATAIDNAGFRETAFSNKLGDRRAFHVC